MMTLPTVHSVQGYKCASSPDLARMPSAVGLLEIAETTFSSLILEDSCCNLVTTDVILLERKHVVSNPFSELTRLANSASHSRLPTALDYRFSYVVSQACW